MADPKIGALNASDFYIEAGNSGLKVFGGYVVEDYDPTLRGIRGMRMLREMQDSDPTVGAILFLIGQTIRQVAWHFAPADQSLPSLIAQEFYESLLDDMEMTWDDFMAEVISMFTFGFAPFEIVLKQRNGKNADPKLSSRFEDKMIGIRKLALRSQETVLRWIFDADNNDVLGMVQMPWTGGIRTIPIEKLLMFRTISTRNNPEGRSLLRNAYRPYYFRKRIEEIEAIGIERDLAGLPVMRVPGELIAAATGNGDPQAMASLAGYKQLVTNIRRNTQEGVVLPSTNDAQGKPLFELSLLRSGGDRQFDTTKIIERYTQAIATCTMSDFLVMGQGRGSGGSSTSGGSSGGGAMASKVEMFYTSIETMVQQIAAALNSQLIPLLGELNGIPAKYWPKIYSDKAEQIDIGKLGAYINALAASGMPLFPNQQLQNYLLDIAGLPEPDDDTQQQQQQAQQLDQQHQMAQSVAGIHQAGAQAAGAVQQTQVAQHTTQQDGEAIAAGKPPPSTLPPPTMGGGGGNAGRPGGPAQGAFGAKRSGFAKRYFPAYVEAA